VAIAQEEKGKAEKLWRVRERGRVYVGVEHTGDNVNSFAE